MLKAMNLLHEITGVFVPGAAFINLFLVVDIVPLKARIIFDPQIVEFDQSVLRLLPGKSPGE